MTKVRRVAALAAGCSLVLGIGSLAVGSSSGRGIKRPQSPASSTSGQVPAAERDCRYEATPIETPPPASLLAIAPSGSVRNGGGAGEGGIAGTCPQEISTLTSSDFGPGTYILEAGMAEGEIAAASYTVAASAFPLRIDSTEIIFGTSNATVQTTTKWTVMIWEGTPATGTLKYLYSSDGEVLPNIVLPPGTTGVDVQFAVQAETPADELVITDNGSHTFSIGYRIDHHNAQTANPCLVSPPSCCNAFPAVDTGGLQHAAQNWLYAIDCGAFGCPSGWHSFAQLPVFCRPTGDWVLRATWTSYACEPQGACCIPGGICDFLTASECAAQNGTYLGDNTPCGIGSCQAVNVACCFAATGGCLNLPSATCVSAGGVPGPAGSNCTGYVCFPTGACCLPNGQCIGPVSPETCAAQGGTFKGNNTSCGSVTCPQPTGACCFGTGFCLVLTQADCQLAGATWIPGGTTCADANANGQADACESNPADFNHDGHVNSADLGVLLGAWGVSSGPADLDHDGDVDPNDLAILLGAWG
ncbi:MAG: hypothetical protein U0572_12700 [Phycisphaerales bacterium]